MIFFASSFIDIILRRISLRFRSITTNYLICGQTTLASHWPGQHGLASYWLENLHSLGQLAHMIIDQCCAVRYYKIANQLLKLGYYTPPVMNCEAVSNRQCVLLLYTQRMSIILCINVKGASEETRKSRYEAMICLKFLTKLLKSISRCSLFKA